MIYSIDLSKNENSIFGNSFIDVSDDGDYDTSVNLAPSIALSTT